MKNFLKKGLHKLFGFHTYLYLFSQYIIHTLKWNKNEKDFLFFLKMVPDAGTVLDIGANIGIMTYHFSKKLKNTNIFAFEPMPENIITLKRIVKRYKLKNVTIFPLALGDKTGKVQMVMPVVDSVKMQGLSHVMQESIENNNIGNYFEAPVTSIDNIPRITTNGTKVSAIKLDVENYEYFVLKGAEETIKKNKPLIYCELWDNENRDKCISFLQGLNYDVKILKNKSLINFREPQPKSQNFFFIPSSN